MQDFFNRFSLRTIKFDWPVILVLAVIWLVVLGCVISSILAQPLAGRQKTFWVAVVVCVPLFGVLAYLPFSFKKEDLPHIFLAKAKKSKKRRTGQPPGASNRDM
jgi:uncharacterized membrane protein YhaH (DUF805 family)